MICKCCGKENLLKAHYCASCGTAFSQEDRDGAYEKTIFGRIDKLLELKGWITLDNILGHWIVKTLVMAGLILLFLLNMAQNGKDLALRNGENYTLGKNGEEYYVMTDRDQVDVSIYVPKKTEMLEVSFYGQEGEVGSFPIAPEEGITLLRREDGYYELRADYEDGSKESLTFFVCKGDHNG